MAQIDLIHKRIGNDIQFEVQLLDQGTAIDWTEISRIYAALYSVPQRVRMGRLSVDGPAPLDSTKLRLTYSAKSPQFLGLAKLVMELDYRGTICTVDTPALVFVKATAQEGTGPVEINTDPSVNSDNTQLQIVIGKTFVTDWGEIRGDINDQADLKGALDAKQDVIEDLSAIREGASLGSTAVQPTDLPHDDVKFTEQTLTEEQKSQARTNIGAVSRADLDAAQLGSFVEAWDGESTPVVANIPSGVTVTYNSTPYVGTLAPSASTVGKIYLVSDTNGNYDRYAVAENGGEYTWQGLGSTAMDLSGYATKEDAAAIEMKMVPLLYEGTEQETVNASALATRNYYINTSTGKYNTSSSYKHSITPVAPGQVVKVTANSSAAAYISFFKSNAAPVSGGTPDYSSAYASIYCVVVPVGTSKDFVVPGDAKYMYIRRGASADSYPYTPSGILITKPVFVPGLALDESEAGDPASVATVADAVFGGADYDAETVDLSTAIGDTLSITTSNTFASTGAHGIVPVDPDDVVRVIGGGGVASFVSGIYAPNSGSSLGAISPKRLETGKEYYLRAPSNAVAFIYNTTEGNDTVAPTEMEIFTPAGKDSQLRQLGVGRFATSSGALTYGANAQNKNFLFRVKAGRNYAFYIESVDAAVYAMFISSLPYVGKSYQAVFSITDTSFGSSKRCAVDYNADADGYVIFRSYKSGGPSYTVTAFDTTDVTAPLTDTRHLLDTESFWRLNVNALTLKSRAISATTGLYGSSTTYKHALIPVKAGQYVRLVKGSDNAAVLAWLTQDDTPVTNGEPSYLSGTARFVTDGGLFKVPAGANYLFIYAGDSSNKYWPSYVAVSIDFATMPDIVRDNGYLRERRILEQMKSTTKAEDSDNQKPLVLLHYSDIHGRVVNQNRINDFRSFFKDFIDDTIQTGDLVTSYWGDGSAFGDESDPANSPNKDILSVIGNHDTASKSGGDFIWHTYQGLPAYERYIKPYVQYWGVVQPQDADANGYCFYYKDYAAQGIRLVVLDVFDTDAAYQQAQQNWFANVLDDAITAGLAVIVASHFRIKAETLLKSPFSMPSASLANPDSSVYNEPYVPLVQDFIDGGGELVCWISGHSHYDAITKTSAEQGEQLNVCVGLAGRFGSAATTLYLTNSMIEVDFDDWKTFDLFNIMAVDTRYKFIVLYRIGSNYDKMGRRIETTCIKYDTGEIIYP